MELFGCQCLLVDDIEAVGKFLVSVFHSPPCTISSRPLRHGVVKLSERATLLLIPRSGCDTALLASFGLLSVNQVFMTVSDVFQIQRLASQGGANIIESDADGSGSGSRLVFEGPERILYHVLSNDGSFLPHDYILSAIYAQQNIGSDDEDDNVVQRVVSKGVALRSSSKTNIQQLDKDLEENLSLDRKEEGDDGWVFEENVSESPTTGVAEDHRTSSSAIATGTDDEVATAVDELSSSQRRPIFPTIDVTILSENSARFIPCPPNSRVPIPFETEFFKGVAMIFVDSDPVDEIYAPFFQKSRQFEVQVQGKFKRLPAGEIYVGSEAVNKMELGFMTRSFSKAMLSFAGSMVKNLHYSFGDPPGKDYEIPHLVAPMFPTLDKVLVTPAGQTPPKMGVPFDENQEYRKKRFKFRSIKDAEIDLETTYSFSVNTPNINLPTWKFVNIPMCRPMDMRSFFGDSPVRLVAYEIPYSAIQQFPSSHPQRFCNYVFNLVLNPIEPDEDVDAHPGEYEPEGNGKEDPSSRGSPKSPNTSAVGSTGDADDSDEDDDDDEDNDDEAFSFRESISPAGKKKSIFGRESAAGGGGGLTSWFQRKIHDLPDVIEIPETPGEFMIPDYESEAIRDLRHCPAAIEAFDRKKEGRSSCIMFMLQYAIDASLTATRENLSPRLRTYAEVRSKFDLQPIPKLHKNKKMSLNEKRRRQVSESYNAVLAKGAVSTSAINSLLQFESDNDRNFLSMNLVHKKGKAKEDSVWEGNVGLALSCRYWAESFLAITPTELTFFKYQNARQVRLHVPIESVVRAKQMRPDECPFEGGYAFLKIETLARVLHVVVKNDRMLSILKAALASVGVTADATVHIADADDSSFPYFLDRPPTWKLDKKMLYNCRTTIFSTSGIPQHLRSRSPCELVEVLLAKAINLSILWNSRGSGPTLPGKKHELIKLWVDFLDELSVLQVIDIASLSECERAALFLNLFHVMVIHGSLVLGPPQSRNRWQPFFNGVAYLVSFDVISIAELEHNILRSAMSRPPLLNQTTARIPRSHFPGLALTHRDFRFNFCINHGSISMPRQIRIFRTETLDDQLDEVRRTG